MSRVAAIDLGTNSTRLLVADIEDGRISEVERETRITRLGEGVDERRRLLPVPIARVRNVLSDYRRTIEELEAERILAVGTSAIRDADNGEAFLGEVEWSYGFPTRLLSGDEEAEITLRGVATGEELHEGLVVIDVGGGSTELIQVERRLSLDIGSVRLTEQFLHSDPPTDDELAACRDAARAALPPLHPTRMIGVAGTITTLAALELGRYDPKLVHGFHVRRDAVERHLHRLAELPLADRRRYPGLEPARAPVIVGGLALVAAVLAHAGPGALQV